MRVVQVGLGLWGRSWAGVVRGAEEVSKPGSLLVINVSKLHTL
jgi:hypothetical protein